MQAERTSPSLTQVLTQTSSAEIDACESGFGIIEVVISMFLLGVMAVSFIPLLINSVKDNATNTTIATATQIVNEQIEGARAVRSLESTIPSCDDVTQFLNITPAPVKDPRGVTLIPKWTTASCPTVYPGVVRAHVSVTKLNSIAPIASAVTMIFVSSAT